ncbi:peptidase M23 [Kribbella sp. NPDC051620]|uniref:CIS tube protein n=1 Tax=Kribbella sp. NPDC051620 TaxID=3364120 RepID=UPI0037A2BC12
MSGNLAKAYLELHEAMPNKGAGAKLGASKGRIAFQFNPNELTVKKAAKWNSEPARGSKKAAPPEFQGPEPGKLTLEMFFDATDKMDDSVLKAVKSLFACCVPTDQSVGKSKPVPPLVVFHWGALDFFPSFITSVSAKYSLFTPEGTPVRATCTVDLQEMPSLTAKQNPTSGSLTARRTHVLLEGETLAAVAYAEYGDPAMWRPLAEANDIDDPQRLTPGRTVLLPSAEELLAG